MDVAAKVLQMVPRSGNETSGGPNSRLLLPHFTTDLLPLRQAVADENIAENR